MLRYKNQIWVECQIRQQLSSLEAKQRRAGKSGKLRQCQRQRNLIHKIKIYARLILNNMTPGSNWAVLRQSNVGQENLDKPPEIKCWRLWRTRRWLLGWWLWSWWCWLMTKVWWFSDKGWYRFDKIKSSQEEMLVSLEAGDKLLQTVYLSRLDMCVCLIVFSLNSLLVQVWHVYSFD